MLKNKNNFIFVNYKLCSLQFDKKYVYDVHRPLVHKSTIYSTDSPQSKIDEIVVKEEDLGEINFESVQNLKQKIT